MYGKRIRELRLEKGITQQQLAEALHTEQRNISKYEAEKVDISTEMIIALCRYFEVSSDYLLGISDE